MVDDSRSARWQRHTDVPLLVASMIFLISYAARVLGHGHLPETVLDLCRALTLTAWAVFAVDHAVCRRLGGHRLGFVRRHLLDTVVLVLPLLRPLRVVKVYEAVQRRQGRPHLNLPRAGDRLRRDGHRAARLHGCPRRRRAGARGAGGDHPDRRGLRGVDVPDPRDGRLRRHHPSSHRAGG